MTAVKDTMLVNLMDAGLCALKDNRSITQFQPCFTLPMVKDLI